MGKVSKHFSGREVACRCGCKSELKLARSLVDLLEGIREATGEPIRITSGARCKKHNLETPGAAAKSWHIPRDGVLYASDITYANRAKINKVSILRLYVLADKLGANGLGLYNGRIHVDQRPDGRARWIHKGVTWESE